MNGLLRTVLQPLGTFVIALALLAGCQFLRSEPATQLDLTGTSWSIQQVGSAEPPASYSMLALAFVNGDSYELRMPCGTFRSSYAWDTDGSALGFGPLPDHAAGCEFVGDRDGPPGRSDPWWNPVLDARQSGSDHPSRHRGHCLGAEPKPVATLTRDTRPSGQSLGQTEPRSNSVRNERTALSAGLHRLAQDRERPLVLAGLRQQLGPVAHRIADQARRSGRASPVGRTLGELQRA